MSNEPQNKMGTEPIPKLLLIMGFPMIVSMALQAVYNIVDSYFVSGMQDTPAVTGMGDYAMNALTLAFPVQMLMVAIGVGTGVGINALLAKSLGEGNREKAGYIAGNAIFLGFCTYLVFLLFGIFGVKPYLHSQTSEPLILEMGAAYLRICTVLSCGVLLSMIYEKLLQATGKTMLSTVAQIAGAVTNIILDPIMIFGYFGCPELGIAGAAYATVIGQIVTCLLGAWFHHAFNREIETKFRHFIPAKQIIGQIYQVGIPAIIMQALMSFMSYGVNVILAGVSMTAVTAYGIYYKIQQFVFFAAFGMNNAMIPIIGFNYGMGEKRRIRVGMRYGLIYTLVIMAFGAVLLQLFAGPLIGIFALSEETRRLCVRALRVITTGYLFAGANIAFQGIFQALGDGIRSLYVSLLRLIVITLPAAYLLSRTANPESAVWFAFVIAELGAMGAAIFFMTKLVKKKKL